MARHSLADFALSVVSFHEQMLGAHTLINRANSTAETVRGYALMQQVRQSFHWAAVVPFDDAAGRIFDDLRQQRIRVSTMDLRIAATALSRGFILLSRNVADFGQVPGLVVEDWTT